MSRWNAITKSCSEGPGSALAFAMVLCGVLLVAFLVSSCAVMEPPPGGPTDTIKPFLVASSPDSATLNVGAIETIELTFSEKMDRVSAVTWLHFFPDQRIRQTKWHGATRAEIILENPLPPDTLIVVEIAAGMRDAHRVTSRYGRRFPIATGGSIPVGEISGVLIMADSAVTNGVVELFAIPPDTLEYFQQSLLRRTETDKTGSYTFDWLPVPGGPWLVRAFVDQNSDLRPGENEAQRLLPDTLRITASSPKTIAGVTTLYDVKTPGRLLVAPFDRPDFSGQTLAWTMKVTDEDTGWVPIPEANAVFSTLDSTIESAANEAGPGLVRMVLFVDVDGDSTFSSLPDSLLGIHLAAVPDSARSASADSINTFFLEPWVMLDRIVVLPGLSTPVAIPDTSYTFTPWSPPVIVVPDSLLASAPDSTSTATDLLPIEE
ncbi:MAG: hypothetical protein ACI9UK_002397 [Candidatus Krumholzibacteriia bacterium]|jgi:hypothetical protein